MSSSVFTWYCLALLTLMVLEPNHPATRRFCGLAMSITGFHSRSSCPVMPVAQLHAGTGGVGFVFSRSLATKRSATCSKH